MRRRGEVAVSVSIFLVHMLERDHKINPSSVLINVTVRSAQNLGNKRRDRLCME